MARTRKSQKSVGPKPLDRQSIEDKALAYLDRFDASAARLRRVLEQFVRQRAKALGVDDAVYSSIIAETIARYRCSGLIDDHRFAANMARSLAERGASRQAIKTKLIGRGIASDVIDDVLRELNRDGGSELEAARALVRKRKLGNYRPMLERRDNVRRDLGVLARAGFAYEIARMALGVEGADESETGDF